MLNIKNTTDGYFKDVEIKGNTIQDAENLADIRSVGDKVEGQELYEIPVVSCGKNLFDGAVYKKSGFYDTDGRWYSIPNIDTYRFRVNPNTTYIKSGAWNGVNAFFDKDMNFISGINTIKPITPNNCYYMTCSVNAGVDLTGVQLEEGTQVTPYEPYQEDKLTILSPVQLEKVGDVADRIICKDGVWGVEKNIDTYYPDINKLYNYAVIGNTFRISSNKEDAIINPLNSRGMCNLLIEGNSSDWHSEKECFYISHTNNNVVIKGNILNANNLEEGRLWVKSNNLYIKYATTRPTFIPLPHDQQIKLRTFAGQTNIHFETEIQGTIKAQVPKSLGATVNTHTEQIGNLSKELDRVKKLEESTVSTVTTESDFTTVEQTSNGYFEDVKLEGKTLVNLCGGKTNLFSSGKIDYPFINDVSKTQFIARCEPNKTYTILKSKPTNRFIIKQTDKLETGNNAYYLNGLNDDNTDTFITVTTKDNANFLWIYVSNEIIDCDVLVLEGDHTQNPPSYFEGLMSVGEDAEEVVVSSICGTVLDLEVGSLNISGGIDNTAQNRYRTVGYIKNSNGYVNITNFNFDIYKFSIRQYDESKMYITSPVQWESGAVKLLDNCAYFKIVVGRIDDYVFNKPNLIINGQSDKKTLSYYNNETQTWGKPILRQWDSIEKHSDGKYYYHKRSGEVVLNGSENWDADRKFDSTSGFYLQNFGILSSYILCKDFKYTPEYDFASKDEECVSCNNNAIKVRILQSRLSTQDVAGFKAWLQANPVTVVYQLAQEEVYECTNIDLITYANETNYMVNCGAIAPKSTLKVHNNISNVVKILQEKVNLLESNVKASQEVQDMMILETDMRMLDIELALMEHIPITLNLGENSMLRSATYFNFLKNHIVNETYEKEYLENVMNKYLATGRINQEEYDELYKLLYPQNYDIALPIEE